jgi:hypothetical protein
MAKKLFKDKPLELAVKVALRAALFGLPSPAELKHDYGMSRATSYRLHSLVKRVLTPATRSESPQRPCLVQYGQQQ